MTWVGIDTGVHTGIAVWVSECKAFDIIDTVPVHRALELVESLRRTYGDGLRVVFEDARRRKYLPREESVSQYRGRLMGAVIWEDFCRDKGIDYEAKAPAKGLTKWTAESFAKATGWTRRTSNHARDAALLVWGR